MALSFLATCLSCLALSLYDVIILRSVTVVNLPLAAPMLTEVSSMAVSNMLGFSWLMGAAIRYRVYSTFGIDIGAVARLIATRCLAFFCGLLTLLGGLMIAHPAGLSAVMPLPAGLETTLGCAIVAGICAYFLWTGTAQRCIGFGSFQIDLPRAQDGLKITAVSRRSYGHGDDALCAAAR